MKMKAEFLTPNSVLDGSFPDNLTKLEITSSASWSSKASKHDPILPSNNLIYGSENFSEIYYSVNPSDNKAFPRASSVTLSPTQLTFSAKASRGEADPWTPLSPTFGSEESPSSFQFLKI
jgi:hypothetical protein